MAKEFKALIGATRPLRFQPTRLIILPYRLEFEIVSAQDSARLRQFADDMQVRACLLPFELKHPRQPKNVWGWRHDDTRLPGVRHCRREARQVADRLGRNLERSHTREVSDTRTRANFCYEVSGNLVEIPQLLICNSPLEPSSKI